MSKRTPELLVQDMLDSCHKIMVYTQDMSYDDFIKDSKTIDAVIRNFEIIGEAASRLPESYKDIHPEIDWHRIRGFRNRIVHDYMGIDFEIVWAIRDQYLNELIIALGKL